MSLKTEQPRHCIKTELLRHSVVKTEQLCHSMVKTEQLRHSMVKTEREVSVCTYCVHATHTHTVIATTVEFPLHSVTESE